MSTSTRWQQHFCGGCCGGDCTTCLLAWFFPCVLHGRNAERLEAFPNHRRFVKPVNTSCLFYLLVVFFCGKLAFILTMLQRSDAREMLNIDGDGCDDCMVGFFCEPCAMAQIDTELGFRTPKIATPFGTVPEAQTAAAYAQPEPQMTYAPQHAPVQQPSMVYHPQPALAPSQQLEIASAPSPGSPSAPQRETTSGP